MRKLLLGAILLIPLISMAQSQGPFGYKTEDRYLYYSDVVKVDSSFTVADLYKDAKLFLTKLALKDTKVTLDDPNGTVTTDIEEPGTYKTQTGIGDDPMTLKYTLKLELKKGRYRYTIDNILVLYDDNDVKNAVHTLYDMDKDKGGGIIGVGRTKRVLKAMDALFASKIDLLNNTMKKRSDDF